MSIAAAFISYVLLWNQIYWGVTVITNLLSVIPYIWDILEKRIMNLKWIFN